MFPNVAAVRWSEHGRSNIKLSVTRNTCTNSWTSWQALLQKSSLIFSPKSPHLTQFTFNQFSLNNTALSYEHTFWFLQILSYTSFGKLLNKCKNLLMNFWDWSCLLIIVFKSSIAAFDFKWIGFSLFSHHSFLVFSDFISLYPSAAINGQLTWLHGLCSIGWNHWAFGSLRCLGLDRHSCGLFTPRNHQSTTTHLW